MNELYSDQPPFKGTEKSIFLAGPTPRNPEVPSWRPEALKILEELKFEGTVLIPERQDGSSKIDYIDQVEWEAYGLRLCSVIVFWVPRNMTTMPALTTNVEFGYWMAKSSERIVYGRPQNAESCRYLDWLFQMETSGFVNIHDNLTSLLTKAVERLK
jgi:hypothetical protein